MRQATLLFILGVLTWNRACGATYDPTEFFDVADEGTIDPMGYAVFGSVSSEVMGAGIAGVGDVNGDGWDDIVITAPLQSSSGLGKAYLIFGGAEGVPTMLSPGNFSSSLSESYGVTITHSTYTGQELGQDSDPIGDVNGDGLPDFVITCYKRNMAYIFFGRKSTGAGGKQWEDIDLADSQSTDDMVTISGYAPMIGFGWDCAGIGDFNNDTIDDWACSDKGRDSAKGAVFVFFGKTGTWENIIANSSYAMVIEGIYDESYLGISVGGAGDFNNDGADDIIFSEANGDGGMIYVLLGSSEHEVGVYNLSEFTSGVDGIRTVAFAGVSRNHPSVAGAGDLNGDGYDDVMFGAYNADVLSSNDKYGTVHVLWGGPSSEYEDVDIVSWTGDLGFRISGSAEQINLGSYVSAMGDIDDDGYPDICITGKESGDYSCTIIYGMANSSNYVDSSYANLEANGYRTRQLENVIHATEAGKTSNDSLHTLLMGNEASSEGGSGSGGVVYVVHDFMDTDPPTKAPTAAATEAPSTTSTSASGCVAQVTTVASEVSWELISGANVAGSGDITGTTIDIGLLESEDYVLYVSSISAGGSLTFQLTSGDSKTFDFETAVSSKTQVTELSCEGFTLTSEVESVNEGQDNLGVILGSVFGATAAAAMLLFFLRRRKDEEEKPAPTDIPQAP